MTVILGGVILRVLHNLVLVRIDELVIADDLLPGNSSNVGELLFFIVRVVLLESGLGIDKSLVSCNFIHIGNRTRDWLPRRYKILTATSRDISTVFLSLQVSRAMCEQTVIGCSANGGGPWSREVSASPSIEVTRDVLESTRALDHLR